MNKAIFQSDKKWEVTNNRFVVFLDIMGFKDLVARKDHQTVYNLMNDLSTIKESIEGFNKDVLSNSVYITSFSDSIILFSKDDSRMSFHEIVKMSNWLFSSAIKKQIPLKGAISLGLTSVNKTKQIYFGQSIIDAFQLQEDVNYYGVVFHNSVDRYLHDNFDNKSISYKADFFESKTFLKSGLISHRNLNWFDVIESYSKENETVKVLLYELKNTCSGYPRKYIDNTLEMLENFLKVKADFLSINDSYNSHELW